MRRLMLLRHAKTEHAAPGHADRDRALIERGRLDAATIGAYMAGHALFPTGSWCRRLRRTQETWKFAGQGVQAGARRRQLLEKLYGANAARILARHQGHPGKRRIPLLIVGHNPGLHELALMLIATGDVDARERLRENLPTCGPCHPRFRHRRLERAASRPGRLVRFVTPKLLEAADD